MAGLITSFKEDKQAQFQFIGLIVTMCLFFWGVLRIMLFYTMPLLIWEIAIYGIIIGFLFYLFAYGPMKGENKAQKHVQAIDYSDAMMRRGTKQPEDKMLPFREVYEIPINYDDNGSLEVKLKSKAYKEHHISFLKSRIKPNVTEKEEVITGDNLKTLLSLLSPKLNELRVKGLLENIVKNVDPKKLKKSADQNEEIEALKVEVKDDLKEWDIDEVTDEEKNTLKDFHVYYVILDSPQSYEDEKDSWSELFIVIPHFTYEEAMAAHKGLGFYNGWPVDTRQCFCFWEYLFDLTHEIQVHYLVFSENFDKPYLEPLKTLKANAYAFLQLKVMEVWNNHLIVEPGTLEKKTNFFQDKARSIENALSVVIQDDARSNIAFSKYLGNVIEKTLTAENEKLRRKFLIAIGGILLITLTFGFIIAVIL